MKKRYVASDHVKKILRSLPSRWRPKVTAIEEAKDLNTLSIEDLISSLKCHEIGMNEHKHSKESLHKLSKQMNLKMTHLVEIQMRILLLFKRWICFPT